MNSTIRRLLIILVALMVGVSLSAPAVRASDFPEYTDEEIQELIDVAFDELPSLQPEGGEVQITGDNALDDRIWDIAFGRGYEIQPTAATVDLVSNDGHLMQQLAADAWESLRSEAADAGHVIAITSGYRSIEEQRNLFNAKLYSTTDAAIDERLSRAAPPGASRHHTGYAFDIREVGDTFGDFGATGSYHWLAADNYANAKRYGFLPSYPPAITDAGPDPEPWEWVYVGEEVIFHDGPFFDVLPTHLFATSIEWLSSTGITRGCSADGSYFCPDLTVDRGQIAAFFRRALDLQFVEDDFFEDDSESIFERDINAIAKAGITRGCNPPANSRYCPTHDLDRGAIAAFIRRALELPASDVDYFQDDNGSVFEDDINAIAEAGITRGCGEGLYCPQAPVSRGEIAAMLHRSRDRLPG